MDQLENGKKFLDDVMATFEKLILLPPLKRGCLSK